MCAMETINATQAIDEIVALLNTRAKGRYGLTAVTQQQHALQCASLAEQTGEPVEMVVAALLHDIGHIVHELGEDFADQGVDDLHEELGLRYLARWFGPEVTEPVALHVAAKRYLCAAEPDYRAKLSEDSEKSLRLQGEPMSEEERATFEGHRFWREALRLRRLDDLAKDPAAKTPPVEHFRPHLEACVQAGSSAASAASEKMASTPGSPLVS